MAEDKKGFILYADQKELFSQLTNEQAGELIKHIYSYVNDENPKSDNLLINMAFTPIKQQLKRDLKRFEDTCTKRAINGRKGGQAKQANARLAKKSLANLADNDNDNDNESDIKEEPKHDLWGSQGIKPPKNALMCQAYFQNQKETNNYNYDTEATAVRFFEHYGAKGWRVNGDKITNWQYMANKWARSESDREPSKTEVKVGF